MPNLAYVKRRKAQQSIESFCLALSLLRSTMFLTKDLVTQGRCFGVLCQRENIFGI